MEPFLMIPPLQIYLVRHADTAWSLTGQHTGRTDLPLTAEGETAARALAQRLRGVPFSSVFAGPSERARRTCEFAGLGAAPEIEPDLGEWDYGAYEGRRTTEIHQKRPRWNIFADGCPDGESPAQVTERADQLIARLRGLEGNVALFTHGHFGRVLGVRWIGLPVVDGQRFLLGPAAFSVLGFDHERSEEPVIVLWNCGPMGDFAPASPAPPTHDEIRAMKKRAVDRWENEGGEIPHSAPRRV
jgi:broad specificity phosphatase PhoE